MPLLNATFHNIASARKNPSSPWSLGKDIFIGNCPPPDGDFFDELVALFIVDDDISIGCIANVCLSNSVIGASLELNSGIFAAFFSTSLFVPRAFRNILICASLYSSSSSFVGIISEGITESLLRTLSKAARISRSSPPLSSSSSSSSFTNAAMNTFSLPTLFATSFVSSKTSKTLSLSTKMMTTSNSFVLAKSGDTVTETLCGSILSMHSNANCVVANRLSPVTSTERFPSATATRPSKELVKRPMSSSSSSALPSALPSVLVSSSRFVLSLALTIANCNCSLNSFRIDGKSFPVVGDLIGNGGIGCPSSSSSFPLSFDADGDEDAISVFDKSKPPKSLSLPSLFVFHLGFYKILNPNAFLRPSFGQRRKRFWRKRARATHTHT